ncbi:MAG TPA: lytic transglycosylase domain-containing protein [Candidatus Deferrimicrobium sp.]|nr:lytic transglycosylase domain-containing protein [Candidatus Deferrimicrobium sp.]
MKKNIFAASVILIAIALPASNLFGEKILVKQDKDGRIIVSNIYTDNRFVLKDSQRIQFKSSVKTSRSTKIPSLYLDKIKQLSRKYDITESLILAVAKAESSFNPFALSPKGAMGIMQLMPGTARQYGVSNAYNVDQNLEAGARHLKYLYNKYDGALHLTLAAYNAGEEAIAKYDGVPPYEETRTYVKRVMKYMGLTYSGLTKNNSHPKIYKIVTAEGRIIITDTKPFNVRGQVSVIN